MNDRIWPREHQAFMAIIKAHQEWRSPVGPSYLQNFPFAIGLSHVIGPENEHLSDFGLHWDLLACAFWRRATGGAATATSHLPPWPQRKEDMSRRA